MIICKFGGTSVGDTAAIRRLGEIIATRSADRPVVVVSALSGVTNRLLELAAAAAHRPETVPSIVESLLERHRVVITELGIDTGLLHGIGQDLDGFVQRTKADRSYPSTGAAVDAVGSFGELWSSRIVTASLAKQGVASVWVDIRPLMVTDDRFTRATPDLDILTERSGDVIAPLVAEGKVPVTQGFIGTAADGRPTTLGRGGSDFTAALLGAALRASRVEIWTDVDGILTADPRIVPNATRLPDATYDEAAELATFGAKVLHPATQVPLANLGIPFAILNSFAPERPGTMVYPDAERWTPGPSPIRSIAWRKGVILINVKAPRMVGAFGFLRALFAVFERHEIPVDVIATSEVNVSLTIDAPTNIDAVMGDLRELGEVTVLDRRAIVAVVGVGLRATKGLAARVFQAVRDIHVEVISQGASEISITFIVHEDDGPAAVRALHREFLERQD